jgi:DNA adenine methylase
LGTVGIFFDPPYSHYVGRCEEIYDEESADVSTAVRKWALERGERPTYRIVIAGYEGEHDELEKYGWRVVTWKAQGGYGNMGKAKGNENRKRERLWLSPHCLWEERSLIQLNIFNDPAQ